MNNFTTEEKQLILKVADTAIKHGLQTNATLNIEPKNYPAKLQENGACFVTLEIHNTLRGCIGTLRAFQSLIADVAKNTFAAAFEDPRFLPITKEEYPLLTKHISILSKPELMHFHSEEELIKQIRPQVDGLILTDQGYCGTFLPSVWKSIPDTKTFLQHLKLKAGLPKDYWSNTLKVKRYTTLIIE